VPVTISDSILAAAHLTEPELRRELAVALFREERLTLGQACHLADMDQFAFQCILADREIPVHYGIEEFHEDLLTIHALARR
jgi:predicted HTH domain antitoxin